MALPVLLDVEMNVDGAVALCLALGAEALDLRAVVAGGGGISASQSVDNTQRILSELRPQSMPLVGIGLDAPIACERTVDLGANGVCGVELPMTGEIEARSATEVYREFLSGAGERCVITTGPLTTLAAMMTALGAEMKGLAKVCVCGGAVWTKGNASATVESNFGRDPAAAEAVCTSGLAVTVAPLDVTNYICLDASNVAHLAASGYRTGELAARVLEPLIEEDEEPSYGRTYAAGLVAVGSAIWPDLFLKTRMRLEIATGGKDAGRCKPGLGGDKSRHVDLLTAVNAVDLLENMLESLCHEEFVV